MISTIYSEIEVDLIEKTELELFNRFPILFLSKFDRGNSQIHEILGTRVKSTFNQNFISLNADYDREKKVNELIDGVYIKTNKIQLKFCFKQLKNLNVQIEKGDLIIFPFDKEKERYEVLSAEYGDFIPSVHIPLHLIVQIDLSHKFSD